MTLIEQIDDILPQTQCRQCGYDGCMAYACAIAMEGAPINRCAPGGQKGIDELARLLDRPSCTLDPEYGQEVPLEVAQINAEQCIGCRKCVAVCPTNAIVGAPKRLHGVLTDWCTGCALCLIPCPVDCIEMVPAPFEWTRERADAARMRYRAKLDREKARAEAHQKRMARDTSEDKKKNLIADIMARVNKKH